MKKLSAISAIIAILIALPIGATSRAQLVNTLIGTGAHGHTFPGATTPYGTVQLSPDTRMTDWDAAGGYHYSDSTLYGFSHRHTSGSGGPSKAEILFRPTHQTPSLRPDGYITPPARFSHASEVAQAGYYKVALTGEHITAELTATAHAGVHRYTFRRRSTPRIVIDLKHSTAGIINVPQAQINVVSKYEVTGYRHIGRHAKLYFYTRFSRPITYHEIYSNCIPTLKKSVTDDNLQIALQFDYNIVTAVVGISTTSIEAAKQNAEIEVGDRTFDQVKQQTQHIWDEALASIAVEGGTSQQQEIFYTALYHTMVHPNITTDAEPNDTPDNLATISTWDTFRSWVPMVALTDTNILRRTTQTMMRQFRGMRKSIQVWGMIGYHEVAYLLTALRCGCLADDPHEVLQAMIAAASTSRKGLNLYREHGYIPCELSRESVSCLLEYAYDDWCIAKFARIIGERDTASEFYRRAAYYVNAFDSGTKFFRARRLNGNWDDDFNPYTAGREFTEATAWQYRFFVPHDIHGLIQQFGSEQMFEEALDSLFNTQSSQGIGLVDITGWHGQYAHGNEPSHNFAYLYNFIGKGWKTQQATRMLLDEMYTTQPDGISGNEDCGQLSAWYILSALGIYEVCPGSGQYALTTPLFPRTTLRLASGHTLTITANNPDKNLYIKSVTFNGKPVKTSFITHEMLFKGGHLHFNLSPSPTKFASSPEARPYSMSAGKRVATPHIIGDVALFINSTEIEFGTPTPGATIHYTLDGSQPSQQSPIARGKITINSDCTIKAVACRKGYTPSETLTAVAQSTSLLPAKSPESIYPGLDYRYFTGNFRRTADMANYMPVDSGYIALPDITQAPDADHFGYIFEGYILVPESGIYSFMTICDDGAVLYIDGEKTVDNDGSHAAIAAARRIALEKGYHHFRIDYIEDYEDQEFTILWKTPSQSTFTHIPTDRYFH